MHLHLKQFFIVTTVATLLSACDREPNSQHQQESEQARPASIRTPASIAMEHRELHETLARAAAEGGEMAAAAGALEAVLAPHFEREEQIATPPLGLLPALTRGDATAEMRAVLPMTDALERELAQMLREHGSIRDAVTQFRATAERNGKEEYVRFADDLAAHAREEEELLYPAAILVGRYVARTAPQQ